MIYLFIAIYPEAKPLIQSLHLKKVDNKNPFDEFYNEESGIRLVLTGVGSISAATAVSHICSCYSVTKEDFLVNFGSCAGKEIGKIFLCNKITESMTGRTFYPDVLWEHSFLEREIMTESAMLDNGIADEDKLYDMEASAIYQAGSYFIAPHQMIFLKVVTDHGNGAQMIPERVQSLVEAHVDEMADFLKKLQEISNIEMAKNIIFSDAEKQKLQRFCEDLHCSKTMEASLWQCARYGKITGILYEHSIDKMYQEGVVPCKDKRKGKIYFEDFKKQIL